MMGVLQSKLLPIDYYTNAASDRDSLRAGLHRCFGAASAVLDQNDPLRLDHFRMRAFTDGTRTGTNDWAGYRVETGLALDDRPDGGPTDKKQRTTYEMLICMQINEDIMRLSEMIADMMEQAAEFGRLAQEALVKMHEIADDMLHADHVIDVYRQYQVSGKFNSRAAIEALRSRNVQVLPGMNEREIIDLLEEDARKALMDRVRLTDEYQTQKELREFYLREQQLRLERAEELKERRNEIFADPSKSRAERQLEIARLFGEFSDSEIIKYTSITPGADLDEANAALIRNDAARQPKNPANDRNQQTSGQNNTVSAIDALLAEEADDEEAAFQQNIAPPPATPAPAQQVTAPAPPPIPLKFAA